MRRSTAIFIILVLLSFPVLAAGPGGTVYDRVLKSGVIRCGYIVWPPFMQVDSATGKFSGMNYDYTEAVASALGLKVDWAMEVTPGSQVEALRSGKIDAICTAEGPMVPSTIKYLHYSEAFAYFPEFLYARADDNRFDQSPDSVNASSVRIAVLDGDISGVIASARFPQAAHYALPQLASPGQMMLDVASGKADIVINDPLSMAPYFAHNPGKLKQIPANGPVAVIPNTFSVLRNDDTETFLDLLNQGIENIRYTGREAGIFAKYQKPGDSFFYPAANPYKGASL